MKHALSSGLQLLFQMLSSGGLNEHDMSYGPSSYSDYIDMIGYDQPTLDIANQIIPTYPNTDYSKISGTIVDDEDGELMNLLRFMKKKNIDGGNSGTPLM